MKLLFLLLSLCLFAKESFTQGNIAINPSDLLDSAGTIIQGVGKELLNLIPSPQDVFNIAPQILFGLPEVALLQGINLLCSIYLASDTINPRHTPKESSLSLILLKPCRNSSFPLSQAENILESPDFDVNKKVAIFVNGWLANPNLDYVQQMANAFNCRGDYNFLTLDTADSIATLYTWSAYNTEEVGRLLALSLQKLTEKVPVENIYLIGLSLGAHIVGSAGRHFSHYTGSNLTRITGLDPANPCFNEGETLTGLHSGDADFVDVVHSNPGGLGKAQPLGDLDFYAGGLAPIKPGCHMIGCSHVRSAEYFTETVYPGNERNFLGVRCTSLTGVKDGFCNGPKIPMGYAVPYDLKGTFFADVNAEPPYGQNNGGRSAVPRKCKKKCN